MKEFLQPISGFPELSPEEQIVFNRAKAIIAESYEMVGAVPIETPAVERLDVLLAKAGDSKEIYGLHRVAGDDESIKEYALHPDLTVPLARYVAQRYGQLVFPFKRYAIQPVWRGEKPQAGRYRQFYQADIDIIGNDKLSLLYDAEMPLVIFNIFKKLNIGDFTINVNNRKIQTGFFGSLGLDDEKTTRVIKIIDKYFGFNSEKTFADTEKSLLDLELNHKQTNRIISFFEATEELSDFETIAFLKNQNGIGAQAELGVRELETVYEYMGAMGIASKNMTINLKIARGLDYYTGSVYETKLEANPSLGSICSGGRYDNLTQYFSKQVMPGVGISIGLSRLIPDLLRLQVLKADRRTLADVLITNPNPKFTLANVKLAATLRSAGIKTEVYLDERKLVKQIEYANKKGFPFVVIKGENEAANGAVTLRNMDTGEQIQVTDDHLPETINTLLKQGTLQLS